MPITVTIPETEMYDPVTEKVTRLKERTITLEHSLLSISKWESKWHKPYLSRDQKTQEEALDYIKCMTITTNVPDEYYLALGSKNIQKIVSYIEDPMTATTIKKQDQKPSREIVTSELVYYWMTALQIPFDPCQKWHFNRLMTLIEVASIKNAPPKKMSKRDILSQNHALNAARRARLHSKG